MRVHAATQADLDGMVLRIERLLSVEPDGVFDAAKVKPSPVCRKPDQAGVQVLLATL